MFRSGASAGGDGTALPLAWRKAMAGRRSRPWFVAGGQTLLEAPVGWPVPCLARSLWFTASRLRITSDAPASCRSTWFANRVRVKPGCAWFLGAPAGGHPHEAKKVTA
jgi:hypothetical protein